MAYLKVICVVVASFMFSAVAGNIITPNETSLHILIGTDQTVKFTFDNKENPSITNASYFINISSSDSILNIYHHNGTLNASSAEKNITISGLSPGREVIVVEVTYSNGSDNFSMQFIVLRSFDWDTFSVVIGWIYFVAWSLSFYPQTYLNWKGKSVVGLNFDFVVLNLIGFFFYSLYNGSLYWIKEVQDEYYEEYPSGVLPIMANDIFFSFHAFILCAITAIQCLIYERAEQRVSYYAMGLCVIFAVFILISAFLVPSWFRLLEFCSYVKLTITLIKYMPQAYMNFKRKSTEGWSIGNIVLDFTGGLFSMGQMIVNAWNYNDDIFGDLTKFGLGLFSVLFDILFLVQHYILYRHSGPYSDFPEGAVVNSRSELVT